MRLRQKLSAHGLALRRARLQTLQVNVGRKCNQACRHCHVDAGPWRTEMVGQFVAHRIGEWIRQYQPEIVDLTGGAPELSEFFRFFVETARGAGSHVIDRCNLTIIEEAGYGDLPAYLAGQEVEVIASLPCYTAENVAKQRGAGVFEKSISALRKLNGVGYGSKLPLNLVYNPVGPKLPAPQAELEADYKEVLGREFGISFNRLYTITNQPIARFAEDLRRQGQDRGIHVAVGEQLQSRHGRELDVPHDLKRRLDGGGVRLRLQPDAGDANAEWQTTLPVGRDAGTAGGLGRPDGRALPRLHRGLRQQLRRGAADGSRRLTRIFHAQVTGVLSRTHFIERYSIHADSTANRRHRAPATRLLPTSAPAGSGFSTQRPPSPSCWPRNTSMSRTR